MKYLALCLALCGAAFSLEAKLKVVATTPDLGAIAREIGGEEVTVFVLARPTEDPHFVDPKPSFLVQLSKADLLIENGAELEGGWLGPLIAQSRNSKLSKGGKGNLQASEGIKLLEVPASLDRSEGDIHGSGNPHYLVDPDNARIVARNMARKFCELDPSSCGAYNANSEKFLAVLEKKIKEWDQIMVPHQNKRLAAYHNSWPYFGKRFSLRIDLFLEPKPGIPPSPARLASVIEEIKKDQVKVIICDVYLNHKTAEKVSAETKAGVVETSHFPGALKGVKDDYVSLMDHLVKSIAAGLAR